jgi:Tol biopolymer transport system component
MNVYSFPRLSPDGARFAVEVHDTSGGVDVWVYDLDRGIFSRIAGENSNNQPVWTPDGKRLIFSSGPRAPNMVLVSAPADNSGPATVLLHEPGYPGSVSPDGNLALWSDRGANGNTIRVLSLAGTSVGSVKPNVILDTPFTKLSAQFSPDGHLIAYQSNESGRNQIYVQSYPLGRKWTISSDGGTLPRWSQSGRELFYRNGDKMMAVDIEVSPAFRPGRPKLLFEGRYQANGYDVTADGARFLMVKDAATEQASPDRLQIVVNWSEELERRLPLAGR